MFALSFVDLEVPAFGIPITVIRSYDNRVKRSRDFGVGWTLDVKAGKYQHNRPPGQGWTIKDQPFLGSFIPCTGGANETQSHLTEIRLSDREAYTFALDLTNGNVGITGACEATASFRFLDGTLPNASLEILDGTSVIYLRGGPDAVLDMPAFLDGVERVYNPQIVRLTTIDGRIVDIDRVSGIQRIQDRNGNTLTIQPGGLVHSSGKSVAFIRDLDGRITRIVDPRGKHLNYVYDVRGDLVEFHDQADAVTSFVYDNSHNLLEIHDPLGNRAVQAEYDEQGRVVAFIDAKGRRTSFTHDITAREEVTVDARGNSRRLSYDAMGYVDREERSLTRDGVATSAITTFVHDSKGHELVEVDPDGLRRESRFDEAGNGTEDVVDPAGLALRTTYSYDKHLKPLTLTNPDGTTVRLAYGLLGNLTALSDPSGQISRFAVDDNGKPTQMTDPSGLLTNLRYDAFGNLSRQEWLDGNGQLVKREDFSYDQNGNLVADTTLRTVDGRLQPFTTYYTYDSLNRVISVTDPMGNVSRTEYNTLGLVSAAIDPLGRRTEYLFDEVGAPTKTVYPDNTTETNEYDASGNLVRHVDRNNKPTTYEYDELNRVVRTTLADGTSSRTVYSAGGRVDAVIDAFGNRTDFEYDTAGRNNRVIHPEVLDALSGLAHRPVTSVEFDAMGRRAATIDALNHRTEFVYDAQGRRVQTRFADGSTRSERYDVAGRRVGLEDESRRQTAFEYDALGRLTAVVNALGGRTTYRYDENDNLTSRTDALGRGTAYTFDALNRLIGRVLPGGQRESVAYDAVGNVVSRTDFNGDRATYAYDAMNRLILKTLPAGVTTRFTYGGAGQRLTTTDQTGTTSYQYDDLNRVVRKTQPDGSTISYAYDANGNLRQVTSGAGSTSYEYDALNRMTTVTSPAGGARYAYDMDGNVIETALGHSIVTRRSFDARHRVTEVQHLRGSTVLNSFVYQLSPTGRRLRVTEADGTVETYTYDTVDRLLSDIRSGVRAVAYEYRCRRKSAAHESGRLAD